MSFRRRERFPEPHGLRQLRIPFRLGAFEQPAARSGLRPDLRQGLPQRRNLLVRRLLSLDDYRLKALDFLPALGPAGLRFRQTPGKGVGLR